MLSVVLLSLVLSLGINGVMFLLAFRFKSDKLTDASYALTFIALAGFDFRHSNGSFYDIVSLTLVCVWAVRIGSFLLYRVLRTGKDSRFDQVRNHFWQFGKFWLGQAVAVWILLIPVALSLGHNNAWYNLAYVGVGVWLVGVTIESIADLQKYSFTHDPAHHNLWIDQGLWHYSRHPNYFGEILVWVGIYVYSLSNLSPIGMVVGLVSPIFITVLLLFVSGVPILEQSADKRWGNEPAYQAYKKHTSLLVPLFKKREG